jgi:hypothetical protein
MSAVELAGHDLKDLNYRITMLNEEMQAMEVDLEAIDKYRTADGEYSERAQELATVTKERDEVRDQAGRGALKSLQKHHPDSASCNCAFMRRCAVSMRSCASGVWMSSWRASTSLV